VSALLRAATRQETIPLAGGKIPNAGHWGR
jgi:hypothetical protein